MKLFKVLFYLGRFWDWYDLVNGIIDEKYSLFANRERRIILK